jgi:hypothetical protein
MMSFGRRRKSRKLRKLRKSRKSRRLRKSRKSRKSHKFGTGHYKMITFIDSNGLRWQFNVDLGEEGLIRTAYSKHDNYDNQSRQISDYNGGKIIYKTASSSGEGEDYINKVIIQVRQRIMYPREFINVSNYREDIIEQHSS